MGTRGACLVALFLGLNFSLLAQTLPGDRIAEAAFSHIGVKEEGCNNCGPAVARFLESTCISRPAPWCAAFVYYVHDLCGYYPSGSPCRYAWVPSWFPASRVIWSFSHNKYDLSMIRPGDVISIWNTRLNREAHMGVVYSTEGRWLSIVEGNTNLGGSRDGDGVMLQRRRIESIYQIARHYEQVH